MIVRPAHDALEVLAPAKLNLFLEIHARRPDGYHDLETVIIAVDLFDRLVVAKAPAGTLEFACDDPTLPTDAGNLVVRAAERLRREAGTDRGARIRLEKRIPSEAGLGGGSSDAAATLAVLDRLWGLDLGRDRLAAIGGELGSDVPFFFHAPAAVCRGRGERVEPIGAPAAPLHFVLVTPPARVSTAAAFARVAVPESPRSVGPCLDALAGGDPERLGATLFNRLQPVGESIVPDLARVRDALLSLDPPACGSLMSGSGAAYYALCRDREAAQQAARSLEQAGLGRARAVQCPADLEPTRPE